MTQVICYVCKIAMQKTELKHVYKCPACGLIENRRLEDEHKTIQRRT